jgi:DNA N-6-adenine-methyltransferase (Dam)
VIDHLEKHQGTWRVRISVPENARDAFDGRMNLLHETGCTDRERARRVAAPVVKKLQRQIDRASGRATGQHLRLSTPETRSSEWYTPAVVFEALGERFDLDPASPGHDVVPWIPADVHYTQKEDGLIQPWFGFVWLNPIYGLRDGMMPWLEKFVLHGNGICLLSNATYTSWWQYMADRSDAILFVSGYLNFISPIDPQPHGTSFGSVLFGIGPRGVAALRTASTNGLGFASLPLMGKLGQRG